MLNKITAEQFIEKLEFSGIHKSDDTNYLGFFSDQDDENEDYIYSLLVYYNPSGKIIDLHIAAAEKPEIISDCNTVVSFQLMNGIYELIKQYSMSDLYKKVKNGVKLDTILGGS